MHLTTRCSTLVRKDARLLGGKVVAMTLILVSVVISTVVHDPKDSVGVVNVFLGMYAVAGAIFIAMTVAVGDRTDGTLAFSRALPVSRRLVAASRIGVGLVACLVPIVAAMLVLWIGVELGSALEDGRRVGWSDLWSRPGMFVSGGVALGSATMVYLLAVAAGAHQPSELRAGSWALGLLLAWFAVIPFVRIPGLDRTLVSASPAGLLVAATRDGLWLRTIVAQVVTNIVLFGLALERYGHFIPAPRPRRTGVTRRRLGRLANPWLALAWKESCQALPIVGLGLVVTGFLTSWIVIAETYGRDITLIEVLERTLTIVAYALGTLVAVIVGVGTFVGELQPGLHEFWRTRPIGVARWYWLKMLTAGTIILVAFTVPVVGLLAFRSSTTTLDGLVFLACAPPLIVFTLATAIAVTCVARHALYAAILSVAVLLVVLIAPTYGSTLDWVNVFDVVSTCRDTARQGLGPFASSQYLAYVAWMLGLAGIATAVGYAAVRRNWDLARVR